jgi:hypothetical protein
MASTTMAMRPATPVQRHHIAPSFDLIITAKELKPRTISSEPAQVICVHEFQVSKKVLCEVDYFKVVISRNFGDTGKDSYEVKEDDPAALKVWLELLHRRMTASSLKVSIATVWHVLIVARKYDFDVLGEGAQAWFNKWYMDTTRGKEFNTAQCRELIYPCYTFNHAHAFAAVTKKLAYNITGHIQESRPKGVSAEQEEQRLRSRAMSELGSATLGRH